MCEIDAAFPATIHLIVKYEDDLRKGLIRNVMAGGDFAARGMIAGMVLGARLGMDSIPDEWLADLKAREEIEGLLENSGV
ncbi:MAG: ADP-ribosylglycohydrolase family protein [Deltaproteobacteria bacterium]|nr:ADP-ribosylglycohydrolase family protein [Deltaproteobacteria bacterium]